MVAPEAACLNLQRLAADGLAGRFGLYEAIDYTPARLPRGQTSARRAFVHGASPGHDPALSGAPAARPSDAAAVRGGSAGQGDPSAAAGAHSKGRGALFAPRRTFHDSRDFVGRRRRCASSPVPTRRYRKCSCCRTADTTHGHERRRRSTGGRTSPSPAGAKTAPATTGARSATSATWRAGLLVDRASADGDAPDALRSDIHRSPRRISPAGQRLRIAYRDRRFAGGRHRAAPAPHHQPLASRRTIDVTVTRKSLSRRPPRTRCIRRFPISSCRPRSSRSGKPSVRAPAPLARRAAALDVSLDGRARGRCGDVSYETDRMQFIGRGRTVAAPQAMADARRLSATRVRSSIRSSRSGSR